MVQFYCLSILSLLVSGFTLWYSEKETDESDVATGLFSNQKFRLICGIIAIAIGIFKLISPYGSIPILGDFFPAIAELACGFVLIYDFLHESKSFSSDDKIYDFVKKYGMYVGIASLIICALHFMIPQIIFF